MYDKVKLALAVVAVLAMGATGANADFFEDFEGYTLGGAHGLDGWKGWDNDPTWDAPVSNAKAYSGTQSIAIGGTADLVHEFNPVGGQWEFTAMQYIPDGGTGETFFIVMNQYNDGGPYDWSVQMRANLATGKIDAWDKNAGTWHGNADLAFEQWAEIKLEVDLDTNTLNQYYNGTLLNTGAWYGADPAIAAVDLFGNGASTVYYDDISIVPEPATLVMLLGLGVSLLVGYLRRKR